MFSLSTTLCQGPVMLSWDLQLFINASKYLPDFTLWHLQYRQNGWVGYLQDHNTLLYMCKVFLGWLACLPDHETATDYGKCMLLSRYIYGHPLQVHVEDEAQLGHLLLKPSLCWNIEFWTDNFELIFKCMLRIQTFANVKHLWLSQPGSLKDYPSTFNNHYRTDLEKAIK